MKKTRDVFVSFFKRHGRDGNDMDIVPQVLGASVPSTAGTTSARFANGNGVGEQKRVASAVVVPVSKQQLWHHTKDSAQEILRSLQ